MTAATEICIQATDPESADAQILLNELSERLHDITGDSGRRTFQPEDVRGARALFVLARDRHGLLGCGAIRPLSGDSAELKRMYARPDTSGVGSFILSALEDAARRFGYRELCLETRLVNTHAIGFYVHHGYTRIENFGVYVGRPEACCFAKIL